MYGNTYTSPQPIKPDDVPLEGATRVDIEFHGVDHSGASFEGRVFLNNPNANEDTELTLSEGYVGSFNIFGHGGCYGDVGHCEVRAEPGLYDPRPSHVLTPVKTVVTATEVLRGLVTQGEDIEVTVVPVITSLTEQCDLEDVFKFDRLSIVTYKTEGGSSETQPAPAPRGVGAGA